MNTTVSKSKQSEIHGGSILVMWTMSPHPAAPMGRFSWRIWMNLYQIFLWFKQQTEASASSISVCLSVCPPCDFSCGSLTSLLPRGGSGTLGPLTHPRRGSRVEGVRESGKRATTALGVGSASFTEVSQNKSENHYVKHQKTTTSDIQTGIAL